MRYRAPDAKYERDIDRQLRDTRPIGKQIADALSDPLSAAGTLAAMAVFAVFVPAVSDLMLIAGCFSAWWSLSRPYGLPLHMPQWSGARDVNDLDPGNLRPRKASGIAYFGNTVSDNAEVYATNDFLRQHQMTLGTTGSGKTEFLKAKATNALCWGSGFIIIDGKADNKLFGDILTLARRFGRDDSVLVMNYMTGSSDAGSTSNTMNPFAEGSSSALNELLVSLMDESSGDGMWKGRAIALSSSVMTALVWQRDHIPGFQLDVDVIRDSLELKEVVRMSRDQRMPLPIRLPLLAYLKSLPGFKEEAFNNDGTERVSPSGPDKSLATSREQHGYLQMQFTRVLNDLANTYGYIFRAKAGEIDMFDVVVNRRILVVLMPSLEKSPESLAGLGKIVVATLKNVMAKCLGSAIEGEWEEVIDNKITNSASPALAIFDEVGYYATNGMAMMAAQARSLGFSIDFSAQDEAAMRRRIKEEVDSIKGNANLKFFLRLEDTGDTRKTFEEGAGEMDISKIRGYDTDGAGLGYRAQSGANIERVKRGNFLDLKGQRLGFAHLMVEDKIIRMRVANMNHGKLKTLRINRFLSVAPPNAGEIKERNQSGNVLKLLRRPGFRIADHLGPISDAPELIEIAETLSLLKEHRIRLSSTERGIVALASLQIPLKVKTDLAAVAVNVVAISEPEAVQPTTDDYDSGSVEPEEMELPAPPESDPEDQISEQVKSAELSAEQAAIRTVLAGALSDLYQEIHNNPSSARDDGQPEKPTETNILTPEVIAGISDVEVLSGATPEQAALTTTIVVDAAQSSVSYPKPPTPSRAPSNSLKRSLENLRSAIIQKNDDGKR